MLRKLFDSICKSIKESGMIRRGEIEPSRRGIKEYIPNKLTQETIEKSERGEDLHESSNVEQLMEDLK